MPAPSIPDDVDCGLANIEGSQSPDIYLIIMKPSKESESELDNDMSNSLMATFDGNDGGLEKRSTEEIGDLESAAGTNVLRPLFVYRQQLAYRDRVKKGAARRPGIRPRF
jgi:hypothetical protein